MASLISKDTSGVYTLLPGETEIERTRHFKTFAKPDLNRYRLAGEIGPIHYRTNPFDTVEPYSEIDLDTRLTPGEPWDAACETNGYQVRFWQSRVIMGETVRYIAQFRRAGKWIAMAPLALVWENDANEKQLISKAIAVGAPSINNSVYKVIWQGVFGSGIDFVYSLRPDEFFKTLRIANKSDLPAPTIAANGLKLTLVMGLAWHSQSKASNNFAASITPIDLPNDTMDVENPDEQLANPDKFSFKDELLRNTFWLRKPLAWDSSEEPQFIYPECRLRRKTDFIFSLISVPATVLNNPSVVYPVYIDDAIPEEQVGASLDDAEKAYGSTGGYWATSIVQAGWFSASYAQWSTGFRFQTIPIVQGATIDSAALSICSYSNKSVTTVRVRIRAEAVDDAPAFSDEANWNSRFPSGVTTAQTDWDAPGAWTKDVWYSSPDFAAVVQEIVDRGGWSSNNDLVIFWDDYDDRSDHAADCRRQAYSYDINSSKAAKLNVSYSLGPAAAAALESWKFGFPWGIRI